MVVRVIKVPDIGEGIAEVELVEWHVKPGDRVVEDQVLAAVMTDKAAVEVPSPVAGSVIALGGEVGQMLAVGAELIRIEVGDAARAAPAVAPPPISEPVSLVAAPSPEPIVAAPTPRAPAAARPPTAPVATDRPIASPSVRRRAWELGVDLSAVAPTGPAGRVMHADVEAHAAASPPAAPAPSARSAPPRAAAATQAAATAPSATAGHAERNDEQTVQVIGVRRRIAIKMQESKRRIPHFAYVEEVDVTEAEALRAQLNAKWADQRPRLTLLPLLARAIVLAAHEHPVVNARFDDETGIVTRFGAVHLGVATQSPSGLMVPVLRHAEARDLWSTAAEVARLAEAARAGRATRAELSGSTITLTSLGALGGIVTTPVINHPEVAIVGVNRIVERPVMRGGAIVARQMMNLSSSFDHRVVDGIDAARFIQAVRGYLEMPATMFVP
ncbi:MAG TPA: dihydrolipoamide acetyltransferase family protein [Burkholderiaceae bacterium]